MPGLWLYRYLMLASTRDAELDASMAEIESSRKQVYK